ncbi:MAG: V-type ATPase subunit [Desulfurococcales archaeon]|nr:V-type ATPase subunit [Desulfurococcales archaeon]
MGSPADYAKVVPRLRALKARLVGDDKFRELAAVAKIDDALAIVRETMYSRALEAKTLYGMQERMMAIFWENASPLKELLPERSRLIVEAFLREEELKDLLVMLARIVQGRPSIWGLPTARIEGTLAKRVASDPEAVSSQTGFLDAVKDSWAGRPVEEALQAYRETGDPAAILWSHTPLSAAAYSQALKSLDPGDRIGAERVLCPIIEYKLVSSLIQAKSMDLEPRVVDRLLSGISQCGIEWKLYRQAYDREPGPLELATSLRELAKVVRLDGRGMDEIMESARRSFKLSLKRACAAAYSAYPFTPALAAAGVALLRINMEDMLAALQSIILGLKADEYAQAMTVAVVE